MSFFSQPEEIRLITNAGSALVVSATPSTNVQFRIPRQTRWLEQIVLHANVTIGGTPSPTANRDYLEGLFSEIRLRVSDKAGSNRFVIKAPSATLLAFHRSKAARLDRFTKRNIRAGTAAGTYDLFFPINLRHPSLNEPIGNRTCLPLFSRLANGNGLDDDAILELDCNTLANLNLAGTGTVTVNSVRAKLVYRNAPLSLDYLPQELVSNIPTVPGTTSASWDVPKSGFLSGMLIEEFTDTALAVRASFLPNVTGADFFRLKYGRNVFKEFYPQELQARNDYWNESLPFNGTTEVTGQTPAITDLDFLHDTPTGDAVRGDSMLNLYSENQGDLASLEWTAAASANARLRITTHKFLAADALALLAGA
jgi:hypothetical protein